MGEVVVGLDVHLKKTQVTIMKINEEIVKKERVETSKAGLRSSLECVPKGSRVALKRWVRAMYWMLENAVHEDA
jgi:hypothetical protein